MKNTLDNRENSISAGVLGVDINNIKTKDLYRFFEEEQVESSILEFKSGQVEIEKIVREVCAFLNTDGGILIIGAPKEETRKKDKSIITFCKGKLTPTIYRSEQWIVQKIASNIVPMPIGIKCKQIEHDLGSSFILEVPQSNTPPHQNNNDGKYYIRIHEEARHAPHGLIEALFTRRQRPELSAIIKCEKSGTFNTKINVELTNKSIYPAERISSMYNFFNADNVTSNLKFEYNENTRVFSANSFYEASLIEGVSIDYKFDVTHYNEPFLIFLMAWNREAKPYKKAGIFDPVKNQFHEENGKLRFEDNLDIAYDLIYKLRIKYFKTRSKKIIDEIDKNFPEIFFDASLLERYYKFVKNEISNNMSKSETYIYKIDDKNYIKLILNYIVAENEFETAMGITRIPPQLKYSPSWLDIELAINGKINKNRIEVDIN